MDEVRWLKERLNFEYWSPVPSFFEQDTTKRIILFQFRHWPWNGTYDAAQSNDDAPSSAGMYTEQYHCG
jgi:hypothetical protein